MCKRVEEGEKIRFRPSEVPRMSHRDRWLKEAQMTRKDWIIFTYLDSVIN